MDYGFFNDILSIDSTSGRERAFSEYLTGRVEAFLSERCADNMPVLTRGEVGDGTENLLWCWGEPKVVFCTHMDTVPPYLPPVEKEDRFEGRGSNDAKGQLFTMLSACAELASEGKSGFGLLILSGEETGSFGAKAFAKTPFKAPYLVVGEPTGNRMVSASKGTKGFEVRFRGEAFHSGYPQHGISAIDLFNEFYTDLKAVDFGEDELLGPTTWNVGRLVSDNPQNILSPELSFRLYFRTTFVSDAMVKEYMAEPVKFAGVGSRWAQRIEVKALGGDIPQKYMTVDGLESAPASFGSDAPHLSNFPEKMILGAGTILVAHRDDEYVLKADLETAVRQYKYIYERL
ncbi:MAG: M20/M25/M40 family metallo-hydrolase [Bacteroidales bacterium]|nr:M20/M25/M40 family metallo-hydrolase [Bacteroidales bacterium]